MKKFEQQKVDRLLNDGNQQVEKEPAVESGFKRNKKTKKIKEKRSHWGAFRC